MPLLYQTCNFLQKITLKTFCDFEVIGAENVPPFGPLVVVSNHMSYIDPSILAVSIDRRLIFLAKDTLFKGFPISGLLNSYGAHPINRTRLDLKTLRWIKDHLSRDGTLAIFPEGTRNSGTMTSGKYGTARIIHMTGATILPVGITGTVGLQNLLRVVNPTGKIRVNIGTPFSLPLLEGKIGKPILKSMTDLIMERIALLLPDEYRGVYGQ
jgi:1-acyl-sn-glycerol-3-phosphate acyltransferase